MKSLQDLAVKLQQIPETVERETPSLVESKLTALAKQDYAGGVRTGATRDSLQFVATEGGLQGTAGTPYAQYLNNVFPGMIAASAGVAQTVSIPESWKEAIAEAAKEAMKNAL
jgi:hypothetical protein